MALADDLAKASTTTRTRQPCVLAQLNEKDRKSLVQARDRGVGYGTIADVVTANGLSVSGPTVSRHLKKLCGCDQAK
jgi:hypothetical protein